MSDNFSIKWCRKTAKIYENDELLLCITLQGNIYENKKQLHKEIKKLKKPKLLEDFDKNKKRDGNDMMGLSTNNSNSVFGNSESSDETKYTACICESANKDETGEPIGVLGVFEKDDPDKKLVNLKLYNEDEDGNQITITKDPSGNNYRGQKCIYYGIKDKRNIRCPDTWKYKQCNAQGKKCTSVEKNDSDGEYPIDAYPDDKSTPPAPCSEAKAKRMNVGRRFVTWDKVRDKTRVQSSKVYDKQRNGFETVYNLMDWNYKITSDYRYVDPPNAPSKHMCELMYPDLPPTGTFLCDSNRQCAPEKWIDAGFVTKNGDVQPGAKKYNKCSDLYGRIDGGTTNYTNFMNTCVSEDHYSDRP